AVVNGVLGLSGANRVDHRGPSRMRENYVGTLELRWSARVAQQENTPAGCSNRPPSKAAASEGPRRYRPHFVWAVRPCNGSWRTEKRLQCFRPLRNSSSTLRV